MMEKYVIIIFLILVMIQLVNISSALKNKKHPHDNASINHIYKKKQIMTAYERYFYEILIELENELNIKIQPQVNLASILEKENKTRYISELFRNIDFGIFSKDYKELILLIEINDKSHNKKSRKRRDKKVGNILASANIKLLKFYSNCPNKKDYVKNRVRDEITKIKNANIK